MLSQLSATWLAAVPSGFLMLSAFIDDSAHALNLRLTHPVDRPPVATNLVQSGPDVFQAMIAPSFPQAQVEGTLIITGWNFPLGQATALYITWSDTTSGDITESDIQYGQAGHTPDTQPLTRSPHDNKNWYGFSSLTPQTSYQFSVQDQHLATETGFGPTLTLTTDRTNDVNLVLRGQGQFPVGQTVLTPTGGFVATIGVPEVPVGTYTLAAVHDGSELAHCTIQFVTTLQAGLNAPFPPLLGGPFILQRSGFEPGTVNVFLDSVSGQLLGTVTTTNSTFDTTMTWPATAEGPHDIVAKEIVGEQTILTPPVTVTPVVVQ